MIKLPEKGLSGFESSVGADQSSSQACHFLSSISF